ncbi:MAG: deoxyhypusine synthase family protein [Candidatus Altiarchaeota archaeon]|nr:deoxyhypusine synthase family protein [Candidatus Altiarchaeota archaeon]
MKGDKRLNRADVWAGMSVKEFIEQMGGAGYAAKRINEAVGIYKAMVDDKRCIKVLCAAGALVPGGMRRIFVKFIRSGKVDVFMTTGAMLTHDLIETFGVHHMQGSAYANDAKLADKNVVRIYDVFLDKKGYVELESGVQEILPKLPQREMSPRELLDEMGKQIKDEESIIKACADMKVPIFCPSITDSMLGFQVWMYSQKHGLKLNPQLDIRDIMDIVWQDKSFGALILGGGVPKHFIAGMMQASGKELDYAIQVTLDRPEHGGVSGAHLEEAKSWKKVAADALITDIICDATLAFPLIVAGLLEK